MHVCFTYLVPSEYTETVPICLAYHIPITLSTQLVGAGLPIWSHLWSSINLLMDTTGTNVRKDQEIGTSFEVQSVVQ